MAKERDCRLKACTNGQCQHCKRMRRERGEANGRWVLDKLRDKGELQDVVTYANALVRTALVGTIASGDTQAADAMAVLREHQQGGYLVEWF